MSATYECLACSWQGKYHETDSSHCPDCGGETDEVDSLYGESSETAAGGEE